MKEEFVFCLEERCTRLPRLRQLGHQKRRCKPGRGCLWPKWGWSIIQVEMTWSTIFRCDYDHEHEMNYWDIEFRSCSHCLSWFSTHRRCCFWPKPLIQVEKTWGANFRCNHDHDHVGNYRGIESWSCSHCLNWFSIHIYSITYWVCSIWTVPYMRGRFGQSWDRTKFNLWYKILVWLIIIKVDFRILR